MFLINSRQGIIRCGLHCWRQALSLTYGRFFAEFLEDLSLVRLSLLDSTTCFGFRYGSSIVLRQLADLEAFLGSVLCPISFGLPRTIFAALGAGYDPRWRIFLPELLMPQT